MRTALIGLALLWSSLAHAAIIIVPDQYPTIQAAIDAATSFDTIQVRPGLYQEALVIGNKSVVIEGLGGDPAIIPEGLTQKGLVMVGDVAQLTLRDINIFGGRIGVFAKVYKVDLERVGISGSLKGSRLEATYLSVTDSYFNNTWSTGLTASAPSPHLVRVTASRNRREGAKITNRTRNGITGTGMVEDCVFEENGQNGLVYVDRYSSGITGCEANRNGKAGISVVSKLNGVSLADNQADDNDTYGLRLRGNQLLYTETDLINAGNSATGNGVQNFYIQP